MPPATSTPPARHRPGPRLRSGLPDADGRLPQRGHRHHDRRRRHRPLGDDLLRRVQCHPEPPTLVVGIRAESPTLLRVLDTGRFAVNFLHHLRARHRRNSSPPATPNGSPGSPGTCRTAPPVPHLNEAARSVADCTVTRTVRVGAQRMVFGEIYGIREVEDAPPLLYGLRRYHAWPSTAGNRKESGAPREGGTGSDHG
ncbi:flavin reductase family protein [Streptomyces tricolor]|nr:flavin reductase family protein [Streptomyces tricolor]